MPKNYYALIIDLVGPANTRSSVYNIAASQIDNFYEGKAVNDYVWRFEKLFHKYSNKQMLEAAIKENSSATFSSNKPVTDFANPYNPNYQLYLAISDNESEINRIRTRFQGIIQ